MQEFDYWRQYPYEMDQGYSVVISEWPSHHWMDTNMHKSDHYVKDDATGELEHRGKIIDYRSCRIDDDRFILRFKDKRNYQLIIDTFPQFVLEKDPFGPDLCPRCKSLSKASYWKRLINALLNKE